MQVITQPSLKKTILFFRCQAHTHRGNESNKDQGNAHVAFFNLFPFVNIGGEPIEDLNS